MEYNSDEHRDKMFERRERLEREVSIKDEHIVISLAGEYNIPLKECDTAPKILGWVQHLCEKDWITTEALGRFISLAADNHGIEIIR